MNEGAFPPYFVLAMGGPTSKLAGGEASGSSHPGNQSQSSQSVNQAVISSASLAVQATINGIKLPLMAHSYHRGQAASASTTRMGRRGWMNRWEHVAFLLGQRARIANACHN